MINLLKDFINPRPATRRFYPTTTPIIKDNKPLPHNHSLPLNNSTAENYQPKFTKTKWWYWIAGVFLAFAVVAEATGYTIKDLIEIIIKINSKIFTDG